MTPNYCGAGFIGANFATDGLAKCYKTILNAGELTYTPNLVPLSGNAMDARKVGRELGWKPAETFDTGIRKTVQWYLDNPQWVADMQSGPYLEHVLELHACINGMRS